MTFYLDAVKIAYPPGSGFPITVDEQMALFENETIERADGSKVSHSDGPFDIIVDEEEISQEIKDIVDEVIADEKNWEFILY